MKKVLLILVAIIVFGISANAQDVILKQDGSEIKAKVLEITDQQVKYKDFDFQSGPTRNINISDIFMITYENGQKEVFNKQTSAPTQKENSQNILSNDLKIEFDRIGTDDAEMLKFFRKNNFTKYYNDFESACKMRSTGAGLLGAGLGLTGLGIICMTTGLIVGKYDLAIGGYVLLGAGEILTIVSIPVSAVGGGRKRAIKNDFARQYFGVYDYTYQPTLNFGITQSGGVGVAFHF